MSVAEQSASIGLMMILTLF